MSGELKRKKDGQEQRIYFLTMAEHCTKCGKHLILFTRGDMCSVCYRKEYLALKKEEERLREEKIREENKLRKGFCRECGKGLSLLHSGDLCSDCRDKLEFLSGKPHNYKAKYLGGYAAYPDPKDVKMLIYHDHLEVPELELTIPYKKLQNIQSASKESLTATRMFLVGAFAFALKKKRLYLVVTFNDVIGIEQNPVFDVLFDKISEV